MTPRKRTAQQRHEHAKDFVRLNCGHEVARAGSQIRSRRATSLVAGIEEARSTYVREHGGETADAFLECIESWLLERGSTVAASAMQGYFRTHLAQAIDGGAGGKRRQ
ncbi:hypothetical protein [Chitinasiproducens palmae]|uniref:Uncharacterized protein n=1 Tax=Chitinasiproducens palmae TaxID=1770053 RepID=A0A1H2PTT9_9BURK|nr:hypothetical protein [Chitinasiproducens palmae]SDV50563.1 hypothetical protein SAMN05216551_11288 [Chitinasiproducens palmae]